MLAKIPLFAIRADRYPAPFLIDHSLPPSFSNLRLLSHASTIGALLMPIQWCLPDAYVTGNDTPIHRQIVRGVPSDWYPYRDSQFVCRTSLSSKQSSDADMIMQQVMTC